MARLVLLLAVLAVAGLFVARFRDRGRLPRNRVRHLRVRLHLRLRPGRGHATALEIWLHWGRLAAWRHSGRSRQSLGAWQRLRHPAQHSVFLGRAQYRTGLRLPLEEHVLLLAPPRSYKTAMLADAVLHYPGPVLSTTTKHDVFKYTAGVRSRGGRPVHVFNPQEIGKVPSTFRWNPLDGCEDPAVAIRRADGFANAVSGAEKGDNVFFQDCARQYLRAMFHAASLVRNGDMRLVSHWALTGAQGGAEDAENILRQAGAGTWAHELGMLRGAAEKTNAANAMVLSQTLGFMADPALAVSVLPAPDAGLDIAEWLRESGSLYLIADSDSEQSPLAPLFASLASEVHYMAALQGQASASGRLDPPLLMALDEIVQVCPVPVPKWAADSGGKGIQLITVAHGEAQLESRWGKNGKQVIIDTAGVLMLLPGVKDDSTLRMVSALCGTVAYQLRGQEHDSHHDVMTPAMLRQLPKGRALIIRGGLAPVVARLPRVWDDRVYRQAKRAGDDRAELAAAAPPAELGEPVMAAAVEAEPVATLRPAEGASAAGEPELAEVLPVDDSPRPWRSR